MNKANEIDQIFSTCLDEVLTGESTVEDCLKRYPEYAGELRDLLDTSLDISNAARIEAPAGARMRIRVALNERMAEMSGRTAKSRPFWRIGWANAIVTFVLGLSMAGGGVAYAASSAMPGQALYPLKLDLEQALVNVTFSSEAKVQLYTALNDRRVSEIVYLAQKGDSQGIAQLTSRIEGNLSAAASALGLSANDYAAAKASSNFPRTPGNTVTDTTSPGVTPPPGSSTVAGTAGPPEANIPIFGTSVTAPQNGSAIDSGIVVSANNQIASLSGAFNPSNSPAVQQALDRALAAIVNGYQALIENP
ncbi:hypothetical protein Dform_01305 [Dehalogenimonas formicexedens]|uniref:DUF5667 domain-containing protein n=1 Tax=Dehalogenimonas formicexedens TaxID=1839801 RepID=A0A1P8F875_9CHLR|nr:DUF5667 domain-containing protein [Dehalogenimonas formicexedens]APV44633.1 hypothetical protein Dform_01305 [Dehalogenimonas formicexedens]